MSVNRPAAREVPRVRSSAFHLAAFAEHHQKPGVPLAIEGFLANEPAWNLDYLGQHLGDRQVPIRCYGRERYQQDKRTWTSIGSGAEIQQMTFAQYAKLLTSGAAQEQDLYLGKCAIEQTSLLEASQLPQVGKRLGLELPVSASNLWVGTGGHTTCLHYDPFDGVLMQLHGAKRLVLFPPDQLYNVYPFPISVHLQRGLKLRSTYSQVYPDRPDFEAFPKLAQAFRHRYEVVLNPGDVMFIPAGWWHEVTTLGEGVVCSVNRFWSIQPFWRALTCWSKWRAHLGSALAIPHMLETLVIAALRGDRQAELVKLVQRL